MSFEVEHDLDLAPEWRMKENLRGKEVLRETGPWPSRRRCRDPIGLLFFIAIGGLQAFWFSEYVIPDGVARRLDGSTEDGSNLEESSPTATITTDASTNEEDKPSTVSERADAQISEQLSDTDLQKSSDTEASTVQPSISSQPDASPSEEKTKGKWYNPLNAFSKQMSNSSPSASGDSEETTEAIESADSSHKETSSSAKTSTEQDVTEPEESAGSTEENERPSAEGSTQKDAWYNPLNVFKSKPTKPSTSATVRSSDATGSTQSATPSQEDDTSSAESKTNQESEIATSATSSTGSAYETSATKTEAWYNPLNVFKSKQAKPPTSATDSSVDASTQSATPSEENDNSSTERKSNQDCNGELEDCSHSSSKTITDETESVVPHASEPEDPVISDVSTERAHSTESEQMDSTSDKNEFSKFNTRIIYTRVKIHGMLNYLSPEDVYKTAYIALVLPGCLGMYGLCYAAISAIFAIICIVQIHSPNYEVHPRGTLKRAVLFVGVVSGCLILVGFLLPDEFNISFKVVWGMSLLLGWIIYEIIWRRMPSSNIRKYISLKFQLCADATEGVLATTWKDFIAPSLVAAVCTSKCIMGVLGAPVPPSVAPQTIVQSAAQANFESKPQAVSLSPGFANDVVSETVVQAGRRLQETMPIDGPTWFLLMLVFIICVWDMLLAYNVCFYFHASLIGHRFHGKSMPASRLRSLLDALTHSFGSICLCTTGQVFLHPVFFFAKTCGVTMRASNRIRKLVGGSYEYYNDWALTQSAIRGISLRDGAAVMSVLMRSDEVAQFSRTGPPVVAMILVWTLFCASFGWSIGPAIGVQVFSGSLAPLAGGIITTVACIIAASCSMSPIAASSRVLFALWAEDTGDLRRYHPDVCAAFEEYIGQESTVDSMRGSMEVI